MASKAFKGDAQVVAFNVAWLLGLASQHGRDAGYDVEVGDLQELARACWASMCRMDRAQVMRSQTVKDAMALDLMDRVPGAGDDGVEWLIHSAELHGLADDPDHEAGDLQDAVKAMWEVMGIGSIRAVLASDEVGTLVELGGAARGLVKAGADGVEDLDEDHWAEVVEHFGLDGSFEYTAQQMADYANAYTLQTAVDDDDAHTQHPMKLGRVREVEAEATA